MESNHWHNVIETQEIRNILDAIYLAAYANYLALQLYSARVDPDV
jgi:hypothetical protein